MFVSKPNFLVVGVPKGGTSSLFNYLKQHPEIYLPEQKELHYFSFEELKKNLNGPGDKLALSSVLKSFDAYTALYNNIGAQSKLGDVSPSYLFFSKSVIPAIQEKLGNQVKIIITLRDPIERAYSNFLHQKRLMHENLTFDQALQQEKKRKEKGFGDFWRYSEHSFYYEKCQAYIKAFGAENVKIVLFEDIKERPEGLLSELFDFLGVDKSFKAENLNVIYNKGGVYKKDGLTSFLLKPSFLKSMVLKYGGSFISKKYKRFKKGVLERNTIEKPKIEESTLKYLKELFKEDVNNLKTLGVDTSQWKHFAND
ncbi:MAG: sulfotransferase [Bacteroidota bacterium]|uniref:Sulfotransferase n=1 Tax=Flagellimonas profundi TaxID=2915620 RepID=A0ABS3FGA3_9FLAO|nr:sulfotransferase [Allomuricauda profundi]MBO0342098.1 sulfotransferase [Allomuricauda profundi]MEC7770005.1 sulfotransferase [Bacteroidota bacterium]